MMFQLGLSSAVPGTDVKAEGESIEGLPFPTLLGSLLPAASEEEGSTPGDPAADESTSEGDEDSADDKFKSVLIAPFIVPSVPAETLPAVPWFGGLDFRLIGTPAGPEDARSTGDTATEDTQCVPVAAGPANSPQQAAADTAPELTMLGESNQAHSPDDMRKAFVPLLFESSGRAQKSAKPEMQTAFTARLFAKTGEAELTVPLRHAGPEISPQAPAGGEARRMPGLNANGPAREDGVKLSPDPPVAEASLFWQSGGAVPDVVPPAIEANHRPSAQGSDASPAPGGLEPGHAPLAKDPQTTSANPIRDLAVEIPAKGNGGNQDRLQVQLTDRAGEVRVRVRSSDADLSTLLRRDLGDLVTRLEESGFDAQMSASDGLPALRSTADARMGTQAENGQNDPPNSQAGSEHSRRGHEDRSGRGGENEDHGERQRQGRAPDWFEEWNEMKLDAATILHRMRR